MTYDEFVDAANRILDEESDDAEFVSIIPRMIEQAELRIYREPEFDFLATLASQATPTVASVRTLALPSNIIVLQSANIVTPATPLNRVSLDYLSAVYPSGSTAALPTCYALIGAPTIGSTITAGAINIVLGPIPNAIYSLECIGTVRPTALSEANPSTFLTINVPELFLAAAMVFGFGYQRDYGGQSDDPKAALSWEQSYQSLKRGVNAEELRKKSASVSWSPYVPTQAANVQRERANAAQPT